MLRINYQALLTAGDMTTTLNSAPLEMAYMLGFCMQVIYTGAPVGSLILQVSNDVPSPMDANFQYAGFVPTNWTTLPTTTTAISAAGSTIFNFDGQYYRYVRANYVPSSGSGSLTITGNTKGF